MEKRLKTSRYITGFDGLRSLAVVGVILYHLLPNTMQGGFLGVPVFFVVSGYLITDLLLQEYRQNGRIAVKQFYYRRMRRLYPALVTMLIFASAYITLFQRNLLNNLRGNVLSSLAYVNNWWQINHGMSYFDRFAAESPFTHIWSLAVETQNYLIWPIVFILLMKFVKNRGKMFLTVTALAILSAIWMAILYVPGQDPTRVYYGTDTRIFSILLGTALAYIWPSSRLKMTIPPKAKRTLNIIGFVSLALLILSFFTISDGTTFLYYGGMFLISLLVVILVSITAHPGASLNRFLTNPVFAWLGKRSYGIYLYQFPIMIFYEAKINIANHVYLHALIEIILILIATELSYRLVENPLRKFQYARTFSVVKNWVMAPIKSKQKIGLIAGSLVFIISLVGLIIAPTNQVDANQQKLQEQIKNNQKAAEEKQTAETKTSDSSESETKDSTEASGEISLAEKYNLTNAEVNIAKRMNVTAYGDSVLLAGSNGLTSLFPKMTVDGEVGRQLADGIEQLQTIKDDGKLEDTVLLSLGTNGAFTEDDIAQIMSIIGKKRRVVAINVYVPTRRWQNEVNHLWDVSAQKYKNLTVIDWYDYSKDHPEWFYEDQVHPNEEGDIYYTSLITKALVKGQ